MRKTETGLIIFVAALLLLGGLIQFIFAMVYFGQADELVKEANTYNNEVGRFMKAALLESASTVRGSAFICLISSIITFLTAGAFFEIRRNFLVLDEGQEKQEQKLESVHAEVKPEVEGEAEFKKAADLMLRNYYKKAFELFSESAKKGFGKAMYNLGYCYLNGKGVDKDSNLAREWFEKAAENGIDKAKEALEKMSN